MRNIQRTTHSSHAHCTMHDPQRAKHRTQFNKHAVHSTDCTTHSTQQTLQTENGARVHNAEHTLHNKQRRIQIIPNYDPPRQKMQRITNASGRNAMQCETILHKTIPCNATQGDATAGNAKQRSTTQHKRAPQNVIKQSTTP